VNELLLKIAIQWKEKMVIAQPHGDGRAMLVAATQMSRPTGHAPFVEQVMQVCLEFWYSQIPFCTGNYLLFYVKRGIPLCKSGILYFFCSFLVSKRGMTDMGTIEVPAMEIVGLFYVAPRRLFFVSMEHPLNVSFAGFGFRLKPSDSEDFSFPHRPEKSFRKRPLAGMSNGDIFGNLEKLNHVRVHRYT
jgi:hypothetical protein